MATIVPQQVRPARHRQPAAGAPPDPDGHLLLVDHPIRPADRHDGLPSPERRTVGAAARGLVQVVAVVRRTEHVVIGVPRQALADGGTTVLVGDDHRHLGPVAVDATLDEDLRLGDRRPAALVGEPHDDRGHDVGVPRGRVEREQAR
jgi:hypothetical protein